MSARREITKKHAAEYRGASKKAEGVMLDLFTATTKAVDWRSNRHGKKTRVYDKPRTPYQRVLDTAVTSAATAAAFAALIEDTNPAELTRQITRIQTQLIALAKDKTDALTASVSRAIPNEEPGHISRAS